MPLAFLFFGRADERERVIVRSIAMHQIVTATDACARNAGWSDKAEQGSVRPRLENILFQARKMNLVLRPSIAPAPSLRDAMRHLVSGVCVITAGRGEDRTGATVTSATALSVDPPTMIVCVSRNASVLPTIRRYRHFCINILAESHQDVAERFAGRAGLKGATRLHRRDVDLAQRARRSDRLEYHLRNSTARYFVGRACDHNHLLLLRRSPERSTPFC
jgi:flavin reductase (DIM6/NTAB) family NADH-FMN oxidoreductase RutF